MPDWDGKYKIDYQDDSITPTGSKEAFYYWWEDMRFHEVLDLVKEVYEAGYARGRKEASDTI